MTAKARLDFEKRKSELAADDDITKHGVGEYFNYDGRFLRARHECPLRSRPLLMSTPTHDFPIDTKQG